MYVPDDLQAELDRMRGLLLTPAELEAISETWEEQPEVIVNAVERSLPKKNPAGYFKRIVEGSMKAGWGAPGGAAVSDREKRRRKLANLAANLRRAEVWDDEAEWERYVRAESEDMGLAVTDVEAVISAARQGRELELLPDDPPRGDDGLTDLARQWRERQIRNGADPTKFWNGATPAEIELYERLKGQKEPVK